MVINKYKFNSSRPIHETSEINIHMKDTYQTRFYVENNDDIVYDMDSNTYTIMRIVENPETKEWEDYGEFIVSRELIISIEMQYVRIEDKE